MNSKIKILTKSQLQALPTHRLLAYLKKLNTCHTAPDWDTASGRELTKESEAWKNLHAMVKEILATRPHIKKKKKARK